jgi:murein DD-endopeptidase MepM/ murein hydrolase activator NlpD
VGIPVIAPSDGVVTQTGDNTRFGGHFVRVAHGDHFDTYYTHLSSVRVREGQAVSRGQLIGFSGGDYTGRNYLHFGLCKKGGSCISFPDSIDPQKYWLGGELKCFDPGMDFSRSSQTELTVPLACGDHARDLIDRAKTENLG